MTTQYETATLGGGCFWCTEAVFQQVAGVQSVVSGYTGGHVRQPSYEQVCDGETGHAEVVQVTFDPRQISYREILEIFFATHDPTTPDRQGNDTGPQYRSAIFYHTQQQRETAEQVMAELTRQRVFDAPIVTQVVPAPEFWPAEDYHQNYYREHPNQGYCAFVISPKMAKFRAKFAARLRPDAN